MKLEGYKVQDITPAEDASGGKAISCAASPSGVCSASFSYDGPAAWRSIRVRYFDQNNGVAHYRLWVGKQLIDEWAAGERLPSAKLDSTSSSRREIVDVALRPGDEIRIEGAPNGGETAALDYVEIVP